jgi:hypothetical protein
VSGTVRLGGLAGLEIVVGGHSGLFPLPFVFLIPIYFKIDGEQKQGLTAALI